MKNFLLVLFNSDPQQTKIFAKRLHEQINQLTYKDAPVQVSIGISFVKEVKSDNEAVLRRAVKQSDEALYKAKRSGGNQIIFYDD